MEIISTIAIVVLSIGFWSQVWHIHRHKEVRDLSIIQYISMATSYSLLAFVAHSTDSIVFLIKQFMSLLPTCIIIGQIIYHRRDKWQD